MKTLLYLLLIFAYFPFINGQKITGTVIDAKTKEAVPFAAVYYDKTSVGTITDENGKFKIKEFSNGELPLVISAVGYNSLTLTNYSDGLKVYLEPKVYNIYEVEISRKYPVRLRKKILGCLEENLWVHPGLQKNV